MRIDPGAMSTMSVSHQSVTSSRVNSPLSLCLFISFHAPHTKYLTSFSPCGGRWPLVVRQRRTIPPKSEGPEGGNLDSASSFKIRAAVHDDAGGPPDDRGLEHR